LTHPVTFFLFAHNDVGGGAYNRSEEDDDDDECGVTRTKIAARTGPTVSGNGRTEFQKIIQKICS
jgi:hypothetical protein